MGEDIFDENGIILTSFYGGESRGQCIQFNLRSDYVQLEKEDVKNLNEVISKWLGKH
ncbi:MAG: hypothetical protein Q7R52_02910 [archaeon]|nr:hypothetical protein [archaeon]